ncbi:MAG: serine/threonine protein kinase [Rhodocyclaceae bacterium]|nr:serine/threonine protein kinase [Rhodocyclaceae bacterium]HNQ56007.1 serine/threonine-protein kinase [Candidatus Desulfobacillus denitrificans]HNT61663.1 serine/threonine-protein kinase [Candidatus Desulfobacillus denitrificans]
MLVAGSGELLQSLERKAYDLGVGAVSRQPSDKVAVIAIDKQSIDNLGRWPWSREVHARMIEGLAAAKAKVIASTVFFSEPQIDPGLAYINKLIDLYGQAGGAPLTGAPEAIAAQAPPLGQFGPVLAEAEQKLNSDRRMGEAVAKAGNVALPMLFRLGEPRGRPDKPLPDFIRKNAITQVEKGEEVPLLTSDIEASVVEAIGQSAAAIGHLNVNPDVDGGIRTEPLVLAHFNEIYPSLSLMIAARSLNLGVADIKVRLGDSVRLGSLKIGTDPVMQMYTFFYKDHDGKPAFQVDSFFDVASGKIPLDKYRDKIVLIGPTAAGVGSIFVTPVSPAMPAVLMQAHAVSSLLQEHFFVVPTWGWIAERMVFLLVAVYLIALLPRLKAGMGAGVTAGLLVLLVAAHFVLMTTQLMWLQLMVPAILLLVGHALLTTKRFLVTERGKEKSEAESAESNRMLGLAFQGQGQLDMAFDKFRKCPMDNAVMENLYNLALDFERKRQFNKAESVFRYMADFNPKFRDLETRLNRAKAMSETVMLGGGGGRSTAQGTMILEGGQVEKPMLGRYQVEKELGKGAMGVVYLGRDPKINRVVAIKTMALSQEFEEDELKDVKERFFREAETAGRLNHPNIVTIFDAGEEHDLAYIAMEFLKGKDLVPYTKPGNLMPVAKVMDIVARVADALSYAHQNNVVHRDIKPANIMYEPDSDAVKVTDFGIARITDSSKTKTGMVLGTPSYMSPEQLAGKKIDGRSDLFSLGVMLFQMASGKLPFEGDSMAQLMFKIANEAHPHIREFNPQVPECLAAIIDKALTKDNAQRYQTGAEMAADLRACMGMSAGGGAAAPQVDFNL